MPPRNLNIILLALVVSAMCYSVHRRTRTAIMVGEAVERINEFYVEPVDEQDLVIAAMDGMTNTLDPHSEYIPSAAFSNFQDSISQEFAGIGIFVEQPEEDEPVRVITPLVGSPALRAGLLPEDAIIRVNGEDVSDLDIRLVSKKLKGPIGTTVHLTVRRGDREIPITVNRATIELESVIGDYRNQQNQWVYRLKDDPRVAYMRLTSFGEKTVRELRAVLTDLDNDFDALVLDLRGNSGGLLYAAVSVCDMFLNSGRIISTKTRGGIVDEVFRAEPGTLVDPSKPVAVLIDGDSASASEIVAACLQDHDRAVIVGTRTYGKGTVQNIFPLQYGRSALRLTVARYFRPSDRNIHRDEDDTEEDEWGVSPDPGLSVEIDPETRIALIKRWREASYPLLGSVADPQTSTDAATEEAGDDVAADEVNAVGDSVSTGEIDSTDRTDPAETAAGDEVVPPDDSGIEDVPSGLQLDPQLRRAVEQLRERTGGESSLPAAA